MGPLSHTKFVSDQQRWAGTGAPKCKKFGEICIFGFFDDDKI